MSIFTKPQLVVADFGYSTRGGGWGVDRHPRLLADTTGDGRADIVGFWNDGVWVSRAEPGGSFAAPQRVVADFGYSTRGGGWGVDRHPRLLADTTGDGCADIVGFWNDGVWVSRAEAGGTFTAPQRVVADFGYDAGWEVDRHPRLLADTTGDGRADIVGFGNDGVWVSHAEAGGTFTAPQLVVKAFGYATEDGGWDVDRHPRLLADTTGDGRADIFGFGDTGVWVSHAGPGGTFTAPQLVVKAFGYATEDGGWDVDRHLRFMADTTGDGRADIVGFGDTGVWVSHAGPGGTFTAPQLVVGNFGYEAGSYRIDRHPRFMADTTGDGRADIVGCGNTGVWVSEAQAGGTFALYDRAVADFGYEIWGWRVDRHLRFMADTTGSGRADIVGFKNDGVWVSRA